MALAKLNFTLIYRRTTVYILFSIFEHMAVILPNAYSGGGRQLRISISKERSSGSPQPHHPRQNTSARRSGARLATWELRTKENSQKIDDVSHLKFGNTFINFINYLTHACCVNLELWCKINILKNYTWVKFLQQQVLNCLGFLMRARISFPRFDYDPYTNVKQHYATRRVGTGYYYSLFRVGHRYFY